ncbi:MAG: hypothetical protein IKO49_02555 [Bacilli bacterium]|nr:hypothetical protein [Bacilli bacterium]
MLIKGELFLKKYYVPNNYIDALLNNQNNYIYQATVTDNGPKIRIRKENGEMANSLI